MGGTQGAVEDMSPTRQGRPVPESSQNKVIKKVQFKIKSKVDPTFHPFPRLPIELRYQIWELHLPDARVVEFQPSMKEREFTLLCYSLHPTLASPFLQKPLGALPYVCSDSRYCFLTKYRLCFDGIVAQPLYFNPQVDIVVFHNERALELFSDAVNYLPSAGARESVAPVQKAAIRWEMISIRAGVPAVSTNLALNPAAGGMQYRLKLRILLERLPTLKQFAFCYLDREIHVGQRKSMTRFVERLEREMKERSQVARENENKSIAQSSGNAPGIVMLHCPKDRAMSMSIRRRTGGRISTDLTQHDWKSVTMDLETRDWECSRSLGDWGLGDFRAH